MDIKLDTRIQYVLNILNEHGEGYLVGGAVRDLLLDKVPKDYDLATNISLEELTYIFNEYSPTIVSKKYEIISIVIDKLEIEIARYRVEQGITDGRNPGEIKFVNTIREDLARRDFTINAMAYNENVGLIDMYGGRKDLEDKIIRCVEKSSLVKFKEDNLRILRAICLVCRFNFDLSEDIYSALSYFKVNNKLKVSKSNFYKIIDRILFSKYSHKGLKIMFEYNLLKSFIPELCSVKLGEDTIKDILNAYKVYCKYNMFEEKTIGYAILFLYIGKGDKERHYFIDSMNIAEKYLKSMTNSITDIVLVKNLIYNHNIIFENPSVSKIRKMLFEFRNNQNVSKLMNLINFLNYDKDYENAVLKTLELLNKIQSIYFKDEVVFMNDLDLSLVDLQNLELNTDITNESLRQEVYNKVINGDIKNDKLDIVKYLLRKCNDCEEMKKDYSAGAVVYRYNNDKLEFLLVKILGGNWGFPKGHIEEGETDIQAAIREVKEETNLDIEIIEKGKFSGELSYIVNRNRIKYVKIFLGEALNDNVILDEDEISKYMWCEYEEAVRVITYSTQRNILKRARLYLYDRI